MTTDDIVGILILIGLIPATIAPRKGANFLKFWFFGSLLFILVLPYVLAMEPDAKVMAEREERDATARGEVRCPACKEFMRADATICPHCRTAIQPESDPAPPLVHAA